MSRPIQRPKCIPSPVEMSVNPPVNRLADRKFFSRMARLDHFTANPPEITASAPEFGRRKNMPKGAHPRYPATCRAASESRPSAPQRSGPAHRPPTTAPASAPPSCPRCPLAEIPALPLRQAAADLPPDLRPQVLELVRLAGLLRHVHRDDLSLVLALRCEVAEFSDHTEADADAVDFHCG